MKVTLSALKADVGSIGGHTRPTESMLAVCRDRVQKAIEDGLIIDGMVTYIGDDISLLMSHVHGTGDPQLHRYAYDTFDAAGDKAFEEGCYGAKQDLLVTAPSGNIRGAGPGVAEIEFERDPNSSDRPAEAFVIFAADKCGPGAYNLPLYLVFCDPMHDGGLLLNPKMHKGFTFGIIDMDHDKEPGDRLIELDVPERAWDVAALLQNPDRFAVEYVRSRYKPDEQIVAVSATRLHNIAGKYTGKDDPIMIVRTQGIFPAPEEVSEPFLKVHYVTGDARGSHVMPLLPVSMETPVNGPYCHPLVAGLLFSMNAGGFFTKNVVQVFEGPAWDDARRRSQEKALAMRDQGFIGASMAGTTELAYTGIVDTRGALEPEWHLRPDGAKIGSALNGASSTAPAEIASS
jgi:fructose 1,6-bisphosphate aldolase/phosphatase